VPIYSYRWSFGLWRYLHSETMNIWTHIVESAASVATGFAVYAYSHQGAPPTCNVSMGGRFALGSLG